MLLVFAMVSGKTYLSDTITTITSRIILPKKEVISNPTESSKSKILPESENIGVGLEVMRKELPPHRVAGLIIRCGL